MAVDPWVEIRLGTFNIHRENPDPLGDLDQVTPAFDLLVLQESADHEDEIRDWLRANQGWAQSVRGSSRPERQNRLLYRLSLAEFVGAHLEPMARETSGTPERFQLVTELFLPSIGRRVFVHADHVNSHIEKQTWWRLPRFGVARKHIRKMGRRFRRRVDNHPNAVVVEALDCNINQKLDRGRIAHWPWNVMQMAGAVSGYMRFGFDIRGTKGNRFIDVIFVSRRKFVRLVRHFVIALGIRSDHNVYGLVIAVRRTRRVLASMRG